MKIELVVPAAEDSAFLRSRAVAILAARTPPDVDLTLRDRTRSWGAKPSLKGMANETVLLSGTAPSP